MAKRVASLATFTPTAQADGLLTTQTFLMMGGGATTDFMSISDIVQSGQATSSAFNAMCLTRSSTLSATPTALALPNSDGFTRAGATAYGTNPVVAWAATTAPTRAPAATIARLQLGFNAFGGTLRTAFAPGNEWQSLGAVGATGVANASENVFSCQNSGGTTSGAQSISVTYEML
jgi:hypothetical protein